MSVPPRSSSTYLELALVLLIGLAARGAAQNEGFTYRRVMVPVRDGIRLETVIVAPTNTPGPLPILFRRTPYGVPASAAAAIGPSLAALTRDGYIFVVQNLRGRF